MRILTRQLGLSFVLLSCVASLLTGCYETTFQVLQRGERIALTGMSRCERTDGGEDRFTEGAVQVKELNQGPARGFAYRYVLDDYVHTSRFRTIANNIYLMETAVGIRDPRIFHHFVYVYPDGTFEVYGAPMDQGEKLARKIYARYDLTIDERGMLTGNEEQIGKFLTDYASQEFEIVYRCVYEKPPGTWQSSISPRSPARASTN